MFGFFTPRYVNEAHELLKSARKLVDYKRDLWGDATTANFEAQMRKVSEAAARRDENAVAEEAKRLDDMAGKFSPPARDAGWRENCEVFLVAIIVALGVRTYFLQPFTIPTGSMQPTLNGIIGHPTKEPPPNIVTRIAQTFLLGRSYIDVVCRADGMVTQMGEVKRLFFFTYTQFECGGETYLVHIPVETLYRYFHVDATKEFHKGDVIARGYVDTGDHVFVDKMSYNFRAPARGRVFVFNTKGIGTSENVNNPEGPSQYYIKRLAGLPNDTLRIDSPNLYINGQIADAFGFKRVMAAKGGYRGYGQGPSNGYLSESDSVFQVPPKCYFALGDNSYNSADSRYWGIVPQQNIMGYGLLVYWPFNSHWGLIK